MPKDSAYDSAKKWYEPTTVAGWGFGPSPGSQRSAMSFWNSAPTPPLGRRYHWPRWSLVCASNSTRPHSQPNHRPKAPGIRKEIARPKAKRPRRQRSPGREGARSSCGVRRPAVCPAPPPISTATNATSSTVGRSSPRTRRSTSRHSKPSTRASRLTPPSDSSSTTRPSRPTERSVITAHRRSDDSPHGSMRHAA